MLPHRIAPEPEDAPRPAWPWFAAGVVVALGLVALSARHVRVVGVFALAFWLLSGLLGAVMLFLWLGTAHEFAWANRNVLLLSPLAWLCMPGAWRVLRGRASGALMQRLMPVLAGLAVIATFASWLEGDAQANARWVALLLPIHVALWLALRSTRRAPSAMIGA